MLASFRTAVEARDLAAITGMLDLAIEFYSPVMVKPYLGKEQTTALLEVLLQVFEDFHYTGELSGAVWGARSDHGGDAPPAHALIFSARVAGKAVQGLDLLTFNHAGLVTSLTVMVRPLPAAMTLARVVGKRMEEFAPSA